MLNALYQERFEAYYGDSVDIEPLTPITWARIPHFFNTPYYVYQYATCFASAAKIAREITTGPRPRAPQARTRYLDLLGAGGSDHPMTLLKARRRRSVASPQRSKRSSTSWTGWSAGWKRSCNYSAWCYVLGAGCWVLCGPANRVLGEPGPLRGT